MRKPGRLGNDELKLLNSLDAFAISASACGHHDGILVNFHNVLTLDETSSRVVSMTTLSFSNGVIIDASQIVSVDSNQQSIQFPGDIGELEHLLLGRPSSLIFRMRDGSVVEINAGSSQLRVQKQDKAS